MLIKMLGTHRVSEDGHTVRRLFKGETYDISHTAACNAIRQGWALRCEEPITISELGTICRAMEKAGRNVVAVVRSEVTV